MIGDTKVRDSGLRENPNFKFQRLGAYSGLFPNDRVAQGLRALVEALDVIAHRAGSNGIGPGLEFILPPGFENWKPA